MRHYLCIAFVFFLPAFAEIAEEIAVPVPVVEAPPVLAVEEPESVARTVSIPGTVVLKGHTGYDVTAFFFPDGKRVVTASKQDKTARIWDVKSGEQLHVTGRVR